MLLKRLVAAVLLSMVLMPAAIQAQENLGQAKLDEATAKKFGARDLRDLQKVIELCQEAIELGLEEGDLEMANKVLATSAFQRATMLWSQLPGFARNPAAVKKLAEQTIAGLELAIEANPEMDVALMLLAEIEFQINRDRKAAIVHLNKAIALSKDRPATLAKGYLFRAKMQDSNENRLSDFKAALEADPTNNDAWQALIAFQLSIGKLQEAMDDANRLLEKDGNNLFAIYAIFDALVGLQKFDEAIVLVTQQIEKTPDQAAKLYVARAQAYRKMSFDVEAEENVLEEIIKKGVADLTASLEIEPQNTQALDMRAMFYYRLGEAEKSRLDNSDAMALRPTPEGLLLRSRLAVQDGRMADAIIDMERLVSAAPTNSGLILELAQYYQVDDRPRKCVAILDKLLKLDTGNWKALRTRGDAKLSVGEHQAAVDDYEEALAMLEEPSDDSTGDVAADSPDEDKDGSQSSQPEPHVFERSGLMNNLAWVLATSPQDEVRDGKRAVEHGLKACELTDYDAAHILSTLAAAYAEVSDFDNARKWAAKAVEAGKDDDNPEQQTHLEEELESYKKDKPWREKQDTEENSQPLDAALETIDT